MFGTKVPKKSATDSAPNSALKIGANSALVSIGPAREAKGGKEGPRSSKGENKVGQWIARGERGRDRGEDGVGDDAGEDESNDAEDEMEARTHEDHSVE